MSEHLQEPGLPLEQFITALTSQLDRAQNAMAIKARLGYPLTFAVKELTLDLRTHVEMVGSVVQIRPAGPGEGEASTIHLALTTITRPMMEENTMQLAAQPGEPTLQEALGDRLTDEEKRRLEWAGVQTVSQLVELERHADPEVVSKIANVPAMRLRAALEHASRPVVREVEPAGERGPDAARLLRIRGRNLVRDGDPRVFLGGRPARVVSATAQELLVEAPADAAAGTLRVETHPGLAFSLELDAALSAAPGEAGEDAAPRREAGGDDRWALAPVGYHDLPAADTAPAAAGGAP